MRTTSDSPPVGPFGCSVTRVPTTSFWNDTPKLSVFRGSWSNYHLSLLLEGQVPRVRSTFVFPLTCVPVVPQRYLTFTRLWILTFLVSVPTIPRSFSCHFGLSSTWLRSESVPSYHYHSPSSVVVGGPLWLTSVRQPDCQRTLGRLRVGGRAVGCLDVE